MFFDGAGEGGVQHGPPSKSNAVYFGYWLFVVGWEGATKKIITWTWIPCFDTNSNSTKYNHNGLNHTVSQKTRVSNPAVQRIPTPICGYVVLQYKYFGAFCFAVRTLTVCQLTGFPLNH